jgi:high-affinity iron transporter
MVAIAVSEYGNGVDARGQLYAPSEYKEAIDFLTEADSDAVRLPSRYTAAVALLDSIIAAARRQAPPATLVELGKRFSQSLGSDAAIDLPQGALDLDQGKQLFVANCASCHGPGGKGDGPLSAALNPKPPALADPIVMRAVTPEMMFRKIEIGVTGTAMPPFGAKLQAQQRWNIVAYLTSLREERADAATGEGLFVQSCAGCHGPAGGNDGPMTATLSRVPPELGTFRWQAQRSDSQIVAAIQNGVVGSPMPPLRGVTASESQNILAYIRRLGVERIPTAADSDGHDDAARAAAKSMGLLEQSLNAARDGRTADARARAIDAYMSFEPVETRSRPKNPGLISTMEETYTSFKTAVTGGNVRGAEEAQAKIEGNMPTVLALTKPSGSGVDAFWQSFLIILREGFEAILVIGAVVAFLLKTGHRERLRSIWIGVVLALAASGVTAVVLKTLLGKIPASREIIEGLTLLVSVVVLFSVSYWLISRVEAAKWQQFIKEKVSVALEHGGGSALAFVSFLAVYREGAETALFYQALINEGGNVVLPISLGIFFGFIALAIIFTLFYRYGVRIPLRPFFGVTSVLLYYMAFVFIGKGVKELQEGNAVSATFIPHFPTVDWLGMFPTWETLIAQLVLLILFAFALLKTFWPKRSVALPTLLPASPEQLAQIQARLEALERALAKMLASATGRDAALR